MSLGSDEQGQKLHGLVLKARNIHLPSSSGSKGKDNGIDRTDPADVQVVCRARPLLHFAVTSDCFQRTQEV